MYIIMNNKQYIQIAEMSEDEESLTKNGGV